MGFLGRMLNTQNSYQATPSASMGNQDALVQSLQNQMNGQGPNLGGAELKAATDRANAQAAGLVQAQKGINPGLAARQILSSQAANNQNLAQEAGMQQMQQQLGAQQQLGGVLANEGQENLGIQGINAGVAGQNAASANKLTGQMLGTLFGSGGSSGSSAGGSAVQGISGLAGLFAHGGEVPALVSPGEQIIPPGGNADDGGIVPGQAQVSGDSEQNDTVPVNLDPGTVVVPRSVTQRLDPNAVKNFMDAVRGEKSEGYDKVVKAKKKWKGGKV